MDALTNGHDPRMQELARLFELLKPHIVYGMKLDRLFISEDEKLVATLKSEREYSGFRFTYDVPVHPIAVRERPRQVANHISDEAAKVLRASLDAGDVETS